MPVLKPQGQGLFKFCVTVQFRVSFWTKRAHRTEVFRLWVGWVKIHQIPYAMFETTSQFFFKLFITLQWHEKLFCTFLAETVHDANFLTFHCSCKFHKICTFIGSFCLAKKVQRSYVS